MAPNARLELETIVQIANPFDLPIYKVKENLEEPSAVYHQGSSGQQEIADEDEDEPSVRITTRARFTYELDRFNRNSMLIINNNITDSSRTVYLMEAFYKHKFEFTLIETDHEDENEIWHKINQFFQRDFSDIGAVVVSTALSAPDSGSSIVNRVKEWDVLNYYIDNQPATLQGKPKIFISESPEPSTLSHTSLPSDTLLIQTHVNDLGHRPLVLLCSKLISMEGTCDMIDILSEVNQVANEEISPPSNIPPLTCLSTMSKELLLEKTVPEPEEEFESEWEEEFESRIMTDPNLFEIYARLFKITLPLPEVQLDTQLDGDMSQASTSSGSQNYTTEQNDITELNYITKQIDSTEKNDTVEENYTTERNYITEQDDTTKENDTTEQNDSTGLNDITKQNDTIE